MTIVSNKALGSLLLLTMVGCGGAPPAGPTIDLGVEQTKVRKVEDSMAKAVMAKDAVKFSDNYAPDASMMIPGMPPMVGKEAIREGVKPLFEDPNFKLVFESTSVEVVKSGDVAYTKGKYSVRMSDQKTGDPVREDGSYVTIFQKQSDGAWKAVVDINTPGPPVPAK